MQLPSGLYSQYTEVLDSSPLMKYNLERKARVEAERQAKEEALNQYFTDLQGKINTAGVRVQDLDSEYGGINKDIEGWRQSWLANKDEIKRGGLAQQEHLAKYNEILRKIEQSKGRAKSELEIGKAKFEGKYDPTEDDLGVLNNIGKSIYDPTSYKKDGVSEYGWQDLSPSIPEFDADRQSKFWGGATKGMTAGKMYDYDKKRTDVTTGQAIIPYTKQYSKEQIKQIADETGDLVTADKSALKYYRNILNDPNSNKWQELNSAYQSVYGKDKVVLTPQQAAQADAIIRASAIQERGEEQELNRQQAQQYKIFNIQQSHRGSGASDNLADYDVLGKYQGKVKNFGGVRYIEAKDIDQRDMELIGTRPYNVNGKMGYLVDDNGDWKGANDQFISWAKVAQANLDKTTDSELKRGRLILNPQDAPSKSVKTKATVKPTPKNKNNKTKPPWAN